MLHNMLRAAAGNRGGWSPAEITTAIWLDASDSSTITISTGVSNWADKSGNARDGVQATASLQPALSAAVLNGLDVVYFDGNDDYLSLPDLSSFTSASVFCVMKVDNDPPVNADRSGIWNFGADSSSSATSHHPFTDGNIYEAFGTTSRKSCGNPSDSLASPHLYSVESETDNWVARVNTSVLFSTITNSSGMEVSPELGRSFDNARLLDGYFAEIVLIDYVPPQAEREKLEGYLAHKWGLTAKLPSAHPYKTEAP